MFRNACGHVLMMAAWNPCQIILTSVSFWCWCQVIVFSHSNRNFCGSWDDEWFFNWNMDFFGTIRPWCLFKSYALAGFYAALFGNIQEYCFIGRWEWKSKFSSWPPSTAEEARAPCYFWMEVGIKFPNRPLFITPWLGGKGCLMTALHIVSPDTVKGDYCWTMVQVLTLLGLLYTILVVMRRCASLLCWVGCKSRPPTWLCLTPLKNGRMPWDSLVEGEA